MRHASLHNTIKNYCKNFDRFSKYIKREILVQKCTMQNKVFTLLPFYFTQLSEYLYIT